jgi:hypothetical protein
MFSSFNRLLDDDPTQQVPIVHADMRIVSYRFEITRRNFDVILSTLISVSRNAIPITFRHNTQPLVRVRFIAGDESYATVFVSLNRATSIISLLNTIRYRPALSSGTTEETFIDLIQDDGVMGSGSSQIYDSLLFSDTPATVYLDFKFPRSLPSVDLFLSASNRDFNNNDILPISRVRNVISRVGRGIFGRVSSRLGRPINLADISQNDNNNSSNTHINIRRTYNGFISKLPRVFKQ